MLLVGRQCWNEMVDDQDSTLPVGFDSSTFMVTVSSERYESAESALGRSESEGILGTSFEAG